jgi:hypothetical protein
LLCFVSVGDLFDVDRIVGECLQIILAVGWYLAPNLVTDRCRGTYRKRLLQRSWVRHFLTAIWVLPSDLPPGPIVAMSIGAEPSMGRWEQDVDKADFGGSSGDFHGIMGLVVCVDFNWQWLAIIMGCGFG